jgi:polyisoprenoid-binding protein YceI
MSSPATAALAGYAGGRWTADAARCSATFAVRNFRLGTVTGQIPVTRAEVITSPGGQPASVHAELDVRGIDTGHRRRDRDLCGPRFLAAEQWPAMTFDADDIRPYGDGWTVPGTLTVKGTRCPVQLDVAACRVPGAVRDGPVELRAAAQIDRRAAGVTTGPGFLIGHLISVTLVVPLRPAERA